MKTKIQDFRNKQVPLNIHYSTEFLPGNYRLPVIKESILNAKSTKILSEVLISHSLHSYRRAKCRGFKTEDIMSVIEYGQVIFKQGLCFYIARKRYLPESLDSKIIERINNMVVVTNYLGDTLITCYKSKNASIHLRKKSKELNQYSNCA